MKLQGQICRTSLNVQGKLVGNGRLALREAEQIDANTVGVSAFTRNREYRLLRISF